MQTTEHAENLEHNPATSAFPSSHYPASTVFSVRFVHHIQDIE